MKHRTSHRLQRAHAGGLSVSRYQTDIHACREFNLDSRTSSAYSLSSDACHSEVFSKRQDGAMSSNPTEKPRGSSQLRLPKPRPRGLG